MTPAVFASVAAENRDLGLLRIGRTVYAWQIPRPGARLGSVRRIHLDRPRRIMPDVPSFGGDEDEVVPASPRVQADRLRRLQARAALYATPATLCSTQDVADVFGLREGDVRAARPTSARRLGRTWMAPFGDWLVSLGIDLAALADITEAARAPRTRTVTLPNLRPLGGPNARTR